MSEVNREAAFSAMLEASASAAQQELADAGIASNGHEPLKPSELAPLSPIERAQVNVMNEASELAEAAAAVADVADEIEAPAQSGVHEVIRNDVESQRAA